MIQKFHSQEYAWRNKGTCDPSSLQYYGNSQVATLLMNGFGKCRICVQWNFIHPQKSMKFCQVQNVKSHIFSLICGILT
jgi:hypothetical protein